jgi:NAD(P)H-flavin reductase
VKAGAALDPFIPTPYRVGRARRETHDIATLELAPLSGERPSFLPGQFNMLYMFGLGEVAISLIPIRIKKDSWRDSQDRTSVIDS